VSQKEQNTRQALLARIKKLIDEILLNPRIPLKQIGGEELGKIGIPSYRNKYLPPLKCENIGINQRRSSCHLSSLSRKTSLSEE
jgi:hypothetical protein